MSAAGFAAIDGVDVYDLGLELRAMPGIFAPPPSAYPVINLPFRPGFTIGQASPNVAGKRIAFQAIYKGTDAAAAETAFGTLKDAVSDRLCRLSVTHAPLRSWYGVLESFPADQFEPLALPGWVSAPLVFACPDPYAIDDALTVLTGVALERLPVYVGTGPTYVEATVVGPVSFGAIILRDRAGNFIANISMASGSVLPGDYWRVDALTGVSEQSVSGAIASNMDVISDGSSFPVAWPKHANRALSSWPTIEATGGTLIVRYRRRWQ